MDNHKETPKNNAKKIGSIFMLKPSVKGLIAISYATVPVRGVANIGPILK